MSVFRHPICVICGQALGPRGKGRRRLYCSQACRQQAYRLRQGARHDGPADPAQVARLLRTVLQRSTRR